MRGPLPLLAALVLAGSLLGACANSGANALGNQACSQVSSSLHHYREGLAASGATRKRLIGQAGDELRTALPLASRAAISDTQWQALGATLKQVLYNVSEANLVQALTGECAGSR